MSGPAEAAPTRLLENGATFASRYEIGHEIGRGCSGIVYRAFDALTSTDVAVKVMFPYWSDEGSIKRFQREAESTSALDNEHIVRCLDYGQYNDLHYIVMEFIEGMNVQRLVAAEGAIDEQRAIRIAVDVLDALRASHAAGIIHRDVKSPNVLISNEGVVKLTDFGIQRTDGGTRLTMTGTALGTPEYMSPEQCDGKRDVDLRSDIYSVGIVLFELLTGRLPFSAPSQLALLMMQSSEAPPDPRTINPRVSRRMSAIVLTALTKAPESRFRDAESMIAALEGRAFVKMPGRWALEQAIVRFSSIQRAGVAALVSAIIAVVGGVAYRAHENRLEADGAHEKAETIAEVAAHQAALAKASLNEAKDTIAQRGTEIGGLKGDVDKLNTSLTATERQLRNERAHSKETEADLQSVSADLEATSNSLDVTRANLDAEKNAVAAGKQRESQLRDSMEVQAARYEDRLESARGELQQVTNELHASENQNEHLQGRLSEANDSVDTLTARVDYLQGALADLQNNCNATVNSNLAACDNAVRQEHNNVVSWCNNWCYGEKVRIANECRCTLH